MSDAPEQRERSVTTSWQRLPMADVIGRSLWFAIINEDQLEGRMDSTWPGECPTCGAPWKVRSKTMGARFGQPHQGECANGHRWTEDPFKPT